MTRALSPVAAQQTVQSLCRAMTLLTILGEAERPLALTRLASSAGLSPSTTHRLLTTLQVEHYVRFDAGARAWAVGLQAYRTGLGFLRTRSLAELARPRLRQLSEAARERASLAVEEQGEALVLLRAEGPRIARAATPERVPLHCSALGKVLLAGMSEMRLQAVVAQRGLPPFTRATLSSADGLRQALAETRSRGYALDQDEQVAGRSCVGAAVFDEQGRVIGALSLSGASDRIAAARLPQLGTLVRDAALALTAEIGGRVPA